MRKIEKSILALAFVVSPAAYGAGGNVMLQNLMGNNLDVFSVAWQQPMYETSVRPQLLGMGASYETNYSVKQEYTRGDRHLDAVKLKGSAVGDQTFNIATPRKVYTQALNTVFLAQPGEVLTPEVSFSTTWMNTYVYIDLNNDGVFNAQLGANNSIEGTDVMSFSHYQGKNSIGENNNGQHLATPAFTLPADLKPGIYRMRYKVDWDCVDPAGSTVAGNDMLKNGGALCDVLLNVHGDFCQVKVVSQDGVLTAEDGSALDGEYAFGEGLKIKVNVPQGKIFRGVRVRHGYHLEGEPTDKNGNPQYQEKVFSADQLEKGGYVIPASCMDGEVAIEALVANEKEDYFTNVLEGQDYTRTDRHLDGIGLTSGDGSQSFEIAVPRKVYTQGLDRIFHAKAGEKVTATFDFSTDWMNGYVYIDRANDGEFNAVLEEGNLIPVGSDVMTFSNLGGKNSEGESTQSVVNPPAFTVPADLQPGIYRMRYKVDWDNIDPAGSTSEGNDLLKNGGAICDVLLNVHGDFCAVKAVSEFGRVTTLEGQALNDVQLPYGEAVTLKVVPEAGYICNGVRVRHGYHLDGTQLVHGNPQYQEVELPAYLIRNGEITVPAEYMDGDVLITGSFVKDGGAVPGGQDYALSFAEDALREGAKGTLRSVTFRAEQGGETVLALPGTGDRVYQNLMPQAVSGVAGDVVRVSADYAGSGVHYYLYLDLNEDGQLRADIGADGKPSVSSELVSYSYLNGYNSEGTAIADAQQVAVDGMPAFRIPENLPEGNYRARLKVDVNNADAGGSAAIASEGGYVIDFLLNVHRDSYPLVVKTVNGNVFGPDHTGVPVRISPFSRDLSIVPMAVADGFTAEKMVIRHGHRFDGPQYVHGNRQWSQFEVPATAYTIPKDSISGNVEIAVNYVAGAEAKYQLIFSDEFDGKNGSQPDARKWGRSIRYGATWNRWISNAEDVVYLKDGHLVTRAVPNPNRTEADPFEMKTGAIESAGKFDFRYGKVECRAKANLWTGTFPAIWMMPANASGGWPSCGEIDIFEAVNTQARAHHTIHSHWTFDLKKGGNTHSEEVNYEDYHVYGLEWDDTSLNFFLDGVKVWTYNKSKNANELKQNQWPFDRNFYLILNQSVGNHNQWASYPDINHTYEFLVDWIRVYQDPHHAKECELRARIHKMQEYDVQEGVNHYSVNQEALEAAQTVLNDAANQTVEQLTAAVRSLDNYITINQPEVNRFYRVRCAGDGMKYLQSTQTKEGKQQMVTGNPGKGVEATFLYTDEGLLSYTQGLYCGNTALKPAGQKAKATFGGLANDRIGQYSIKVDGHYLIGNGDGLNFGGLTTNYNDCNGGWWLEPVSALQVNFQGDAEGGFYATLYSPIALSLPAGVKAYVGKKGDGMITLTEVSGVPANQGVLLISETKGVKTLNEATGVVEVPAENDFSGQYATVRKPAGKDFYGLGYGTTGANAKKVGFYLMDQLDTLKGFRARVEKDPASAANELKMSFDGESTGIDVLEDLVTGKVEIYDLSGRRVAVPAKGLYIVNGKKVYFK